MLELGAEDAEGEVELFMPSICRLLFIKQINKQFKNMQCLQIPNGWITSLQILNEQEQQVDLVNK